MSLRTLCSDRIYSISNGSPEDLSEELRMFLEKALLCINTGITRESPHGLEHQSGVIGGTVRNIPCETGQEN